MQTTALRWLATAAAALVVVSGCAATEPAPSPTTPAPAATSSPGPVVSGDYRPGLAATVRLPASTGATDLVVLVPGGGWRTADPAGLVPLAERLTAGGDVTATITYGTTSTGATFPQPADDVACAVRWSAQQATSAGRPPQRVVLLGHSAGGHLASLIALSGNRFGSSCPAPAVTVVALIGLAGVYSVQPAADLAVSLFGASPQAAPQAWRDGDPLWWATSGGAAPAGLRVLLLHGSADTVVPPAQSTLFAAALRRSGIDVTEQVLDAEDHLGVFQAPVAGPPVERWLAATS